MPLAAPGWLRGALCAAAAAPAPDGVSLASRAARPAFGPATGAIMKSIWILVADESLARIFASHADSAPLVVVEELTDAAAHADRADLRRDAYGRRGHAASQ